MYKKYLFLLIFFIINGCSNSDIVGDIVYTKENIETKQFSQFQAQNGLSRDFKYKMNKVFSNLEGNIYEVHIDWLKEVSKYVIDEFSNKYLIQSDIKQVTSKTNITIYAKSSNNYSASNILYDLFVKYLYTNPPLEKYVHIHKNILPSLKKALEKEF